ISVFRWRTTIKSKGMFYKEISLEMEKLNETFNDLGCDFYSTAASALNDTISLVHKNKMTRKQYIMFSLADMMTHVEVGASLARRAGVAEKSGTAEAEKLKIMSRIFANEVSQLVAQNILKIVSGSGLFDANTVSTFLEEVSYNKLLSSYQGIIEDMDKIADILFER
ncbi:MAG: acyl-CoA dehydrogenase, partial [Deltaproteobacteria bacterium]|nr:acyl-CoA dehydrogenase [Deltaproteobacteria bacterium]